VFSVYLGYEWKAGMNAVELEKYFIKAILPLYSDVEDVAKKRVIIKVNSGPGRTNIAILAYIWGRGIYCYPGVPNTTHVTQETDQNYGLFKSDFRSNLEYSHKHASTRMKRYWSAIFRF